MLQQEWCRYMCVTTVGSVSGMDHHSHRPKTAWLSMLVLTGQSVFDIGLYNKRGDASALTNVQRHPQHKHMPCNMWMQ